VRKSEHLPSELYILSMALCRFVAVAVVAQAAATSDTCENGVCDSDDVSLMQVGLRHKQSTVSALERAAQAIRSAAADAETICVHAEPGEVAPVEGIFTMADEQGSSVQEGFVAPRSGTFCVPKETMLLVQRTHGFVDATAMEAALTGKGHKPKNPWGTDGAFEGKHNNLACEDVPLECKISVYPVRKKLCPILWTMQNPWLQGQFPGCGEGPEPRRNIKAICKRHWNLKWKCPLSCKQVMEYTQTQAPELETSYACMSTVGADGQCQSNLLGDGLNAILKKEFQTAKDGMGKLGWIVDAETGPCSTEGAKEVCAPHCTGVCSKVFATVEAMQGISEFDLCHAADADNPGVCSFEGVASTVNTQADKLLADVRTGLEIKNDGGNVCTFADVQTICAAHCGISRDRYAASD